jgi:hypothetical protein
LRDLASPTANGRECDDCQEEERTGGGNKQADREQGWPVVQFDDVVSGWNPGLEHDTCERLKLQRLAIDRGAPSGLIGKPQAQNLITLARRRDP